MYILLLKHILIGKNMSSLASLSPDSLALLTALASIAFSKELSLEDLNVVGNLFAAIGATILTEAAQKQNIITQQENMQKAASAASQPDSKIDLNIDPNIIKDIEDLKKQIAELKKQIQKN